MAIFFSLSYLMLRYLLSPHTARMPQGAPHPACRLNSSDPTMKCFANIKLRLPSRSSDNWSKAGMQAPHGRNSQTIALEHLKWTDPAKQIFNLF